MESKSFGRKGPEKAMKATISFLFSITILATSICAQSKEIQGVWQIDEIAMSGANALTSKAQPSMYIFTKNHYSIIRIAGSGPRKQLADDSKATAQELLDVYVDSFISNAGTYELNKGKLTIRPTIAKDPGAMVPGIYIRYNVKVDGNTLTLVEESNSWTGTLTNAPVFKLVRLE